MFQVEKAGKEEFFQGTKTSFFSTNYPNGRKSQEEFAVGKPTNLITCPAL